MYGRKLKEYRLEVEINMTETLILEATSEYFLFLLDLNLETDYRVLFLGFNRGLKYLNVRALLSHV